LQGVTPRTEKGRTLCRRQGVPAMLALSKSLNHSILRGLSDGARAEKALLDSLPAGRTTCFAHLQELEALGATRRWRRRGSRATHCGLTEPAGRELLELGETFERAESAAGLTQGGGLIARALATGWNTTALRWLATGPCGVRDLNTQAPTGIGLADVEAARDALLAGEIVIDDGGPRARTYSLADRGYECACLIAAALRWSDRNPVSESLPFEPVDGEALLMLVGRHLILSAEVNGSCELAIDDFVAVRLSFGRLQVADPRPRTESDQADVRGSLSDWLEALAEGELDRLEFRGDAGVAARYSLGIARDRV
jgi:hypothetical protein